MDKAITNFELFLPALKKSNYFLVKESNFVREAGKEEIKLLAEREKLRVVSMSFSPDDFTAMVSIDKAKGFDIVNLSYVQEMGYYLTEGTIFFLFKE